MSYLTLEKLSFTYPGAPRPVVLNFSLELGAGKTLALLGGSGCGKSTLLRLISGLNRCDSGVITIDGAKVDGPGVFVEPETRGVGMVFQDYALFPHMNVRKNIEYGLFRDKPARRRELVRAAIEQVQLEDHSDKYPHQLSGGQQQRVALARALAPKPKLLLLDEPFSNLDTQLRSHIRTEIAQILQKAGITTILVTHDRADAEAVADEIMEM